MATRKTVKRKTVKTVPAKVNAADDSLKVASGVADLFGPLPPLKRAVKTYVPPPGVVPDKATIERHNGLAHDGPPFTAMDTMPGPGTQWLQANGFQYLGFPGYAYLSELSQRSEYRAPSKAISDECTRKWIKFISRSKNPKAADKLKDLEAAFKKFDVRQLWRKALQLDMFFGRGQIYIDIEGAQNDETVKAQPLVVDKKTIGKGALRGFKVIEPIWTTPLTYNSVDATAPDFYRPNAWYVLGQRIHHSRLITVISQPVPDMLKPAYNFGGISLVQLMEPYVIRWLETVAGVNRLINNFSMVWLKTNMSTILTGKKVDGMGLLGRMQLFTKMRNNQAAHVIDKNSEELGAVNVPLSGLSDLQAQAQEHMAAPTHVPLVKLTGITPKGLNASSEGEITVFHEFIGGVQENDIEPGLDIMLDVIQLSEFGEIDEDIDYEFVELIESTRKEVAEVRKANGDLITALIAANVIDNEEGREALRMDPESGFSHLSSEAPDPKLPDNIDPETGEPFPLPLDPNTGEPAGGDEED